jgi:hypothetical protein
MVALSMEKQKDSSMAGADAFRILKSSLQHSATIFLKKPFPKSPYLVIKQLYGALTYNHVQ